MPYGFQNDPTLYDPATGEAASCSDIIARKGGWENISALDAQYLAASGCTPGPLETGTPFFTGVPDQFEIGFGGGVYQETTSPPGIPTDVPYWTGPTPPANEEVDMYDIMRTRESIPVGPGGDIVISDPDGIETMPTDYAGFIQTGPQTTTGDLIRQGIGALAGTLPQFFQRDQIEAGITDRSGLSCWTPLKSGRLSRRAQVRLRRMPDGSLQVEKYCRPKRMNPLNARALGRAARRLGSFHRIAAHIEKTVQRACKTGIGRGRRVSSGRMPYCPPKRRCR